MIIENYTKNNVKEKKSSYVNLIFIFSKVKDVF
jgi:hypothetical protein